MRPGPNSVLVIAAAVAAVCPAHAGDQTHLQPVIDTSDRVLEYDWPAVRTASASYEEGPTGVTVFHFPERAYVAVDARGGGPGTVNAAYMELGYDIRELDTIVFAGGSWYGLEATTAVASALKDDGIRDGLVFGENPNLAMSVGSIIFDFGDRRLNEIYPDKKLAQAAFRAVESGSFPLGAAGAGRNARSGYFFGCNARSGQGAAYLERGRLKIAAFVVVNAFGTITDRDGRIAACYRHSEWPDKPRIADLLAHFPESRESGWAVTSGSDEIPKNTTISLIVTNQRMSPVDLNRLAAQVHTSMARAIQPFATVGDGDVLYAVSTAELDEPEMHNFDLATLASEVMWDAILASVPEQPQALSHSDSPLHTARELSALAGDYVFSELATLRVTSKGRKLFGQANGKKNVFSVGKNEAVELLPVSATTFAVPGRYPMSLEFTSPGTLIVNPGRWQQTATRR